MIKSKEYSIDIKQIAVSSLNVLVEHLLEQYYQIQPESMYTKVCNYEALKKKINSLHSTLERIIEAAAAPYIFKPRLVKNSLYLISRQKDDWDLSKIIAKMEYYFKKNKTIISHTYFSTLKR